MDELEGHNAKGNKPDTKRKILHDLTYMSNLKKVKFIDAESRMVIQREEKWNKWRNAGQSLQSCGYVG